MSASTRWFGWITVMLVLHMTEQLIFGLQELQNLKRMIAAYDSWFSNVDTATVGLVTIGAGLLFFAIFCILKGGRARIAALVALGLIAVSEVHHLIETGFAGHYTPGTVTAIPFVACGVLFLRALIKEYRADKAIDSSAARQPAVAV